jgi:transcriptional regulator with XRE-family HTH domain
MAKKSLSRWPVDRPMQTQNMDTERGARLRQAMALRGHRKMMALAAELGISAAALSKWTQGHSMSVEHACRLSQLLDVSLDWLLLGRNQPEWMQADQLSRLELELLTQLRHRPVRVVPLLISIVAEIPHRPTPN